MKKNNFKNPMRGFTLIELLVVITIIGIMATIVIVNLSTVRGKGQDTAIKQQMSGVRDEAANYYDSNYGYTTGTVSSVQSANCLSSSLTANTAFPTGSFFLDVDFVRSAQGLQKNAAAIPVCHLGGSNTSAKAQSWVVTTKMRQGTAGKGFWCVDSTGNAQETDGNIVTSASLEVSCN